MSCSRVSCLASTSVGELRLLKKDGFAKFGGKNQPFVDIVLASMPGLGFPNSSPEAGQRKGAKGAGLGNSPALHSGNVWLRRSCSWQGGAGRGWAPWRGDRPAGGDQSARNAAPAPVRHGADVGGWGMLPQRGAQEQGMKPRNGTGLG